MDISIVLPAYNEEKYLAPTLQSLRAQSVKPLEIIVVDSHSADRTVAIAEEMGCRVIQEPVRGIGNARATGCAAATGTVVVCCDADTTYPPDWLANLTAPFTDPKVVYTYGPVEYEKEANPFMRFVTKWGFRFFFAYTRFLGKDSVSGQNFAFRKDAYDQVGGFDRTLKCAEDAELGYRLGKVGKVVYAMSAIPLTSYRRIKNMGALPFLWFHIANHIRIFYQGRSVDQYPEYR